MAAANELVPGLGTAFDTVCQMEELYASGDHDSASNLALLTRELLCLEGLSFGQVNCSFAAAREEFERMTFDLHFETQMERGVR